MSNNQARLIDDLRRNLRPTNGDTSLRTSKTGGASLRRAARTLSSRRLPVTRGELILPGLHGQVTVRRDRWGIPHIAAGDRHDLLYAQGFVHAQERLWQMEVNRRLGQGRLAELFGPIALDTDRLVRTLGFHRLAESDWQQASPEMRAVLTAYAAGVNVGIDIGQRPLEFVLLRHVPEVWTPLDTLAYARVMIWVLSHGWSGELTRARLLQALGPEKMAGLEMHYPAGHPLTLPPGIDFDALRLDPKVDALRGPFLGRGLEGGGMGSNAWVVAGTRTTTGHPLLCNDMHLPLNAPSLWFYNHLRSDDGLHVAGVALPGAPGVLVGHNDAIAWGITLAFTDCEDLYVEQVDPAHPHRYWYRDRWLEMEVVREEITVRGRAVPHVEEVHRTRHGPVLSPVLPQMTAPAAQVAEAEAAPADPDPAHRRHARRYALTLCSMALQPMQTTAGFLALDEAANWDEFVAAMRLIEAPQLNVVYADRVGNIGYWVTGTVPVRGRGQGLVPAPGWTGEYDWVGSVPFDAMPHACNPPDGLIVTCNHRITGDDYPYFLGAGWMNGYRARRVHDVLDPLPLISPADCRRLQVDQFSLPGMELVTHLRDLTTADPDAQLGLLLLRRWDGWLSADSVGGAVFQLLRSRLLANTLLPALGTELTAAYLGTGYHDLLAPVTEFYGHATVRLLQWLGDPASGWVQAAGGREALLARSLAEAVQWLRRHLGADPAGWQWGRLHRTTFQHTLGVRKPLDAVFNLGSFATGGDTDTVWQTASLPGTYPANGFSASYRQVVDLGDWSQSVAVLPPGQSGHLASPHFGDLAPLWLRGEGFSMWWERGDVQRETVDLLMLRSL